MSWNSCPARKLPTSRDIFLIDISRVELSDQSFILGFTVQTLNLGGGGVEITFFLYPK